jgi:hypothetical protein
VQTPRPAHVGPAGPVAFLARVAEAVRWLTVPLALASLAAVGVHCAADRLCDLMLTVVDRLGQGLDGLFSTFELTASWVDLVGPSERTWVARSLALSLVLWADLVYAVPLLAWNEQPDEAAWSSGALRRLAARPALLPLSRAVFAAAFALAGACGTARVVEGGLLSGLRPLFGPFARRGADLGALIALCALLLLFAWRVPLVLLDRALLRAERLAPTPGRRLMLGLPSALLAAPLAWEAIARAAPLGAFLKALR